MKEYEPEIGQAMFGQPSQSFGCPEYIEALLDGIEKELSRIMWNINQEEYSSPFDNRAGKFKNDTFEVESYSWNDEHEQPYNFKWRDIEISWYKYCGRGMSVNCEITPEKAVEMFDDCVKSLYRMEKEYDEKEDVKS